MHYNFATSRTINETVTDAKISGFSIDLDNSTMHIFWDEGTGGNTLSKLIEDRVITIPASEFVAVLGRADDIQTNNPGTSVADALLYSMYEKVEEYTGASGTIVV